MCQSTCSPWLHKYALAQIILFYIQLCIPFIFILTICLCLPCALILFHFLAPRPGAKPEVVQKLPTRTVSIASGAPTPPDGEASCAVCMEDYKNGDVLRILPCKHEFHTSCVDRWLSMNNPTCPLVRAHIHTHRTKKIFFSLPLLLILQLDFISSSSSFPHACCVCV